MLMLLARDIVQLHLNSSFNSNYILVNITRSVSLARTHTIKACMSRHLRRHLQPSVVSRRSAEITHAGLARSSGACALRLKSTNVDGLAATVSMQDALAEVTLDNAAPFSYPRMYH